MIETVVISREHYEKTGLKIFNTQDVLKGRRTEENCAYPTKRECGNGWQDMVDM